MSLPPEDFFTISSRAPLLGLAGLIRAHTKDSRRTYGRLDLLTPEDDFVDDATRGPGGMMIQRLLRSQQRPSMLPLHECPLCHNPLDAPHHDDYDGAHHFEDCMEAAAQRLRLEQGLLAAQKERDPIGDDEAHNVHTRETRSL